MSEHPLSRHIPLKAVPLLEGMFNRYPLRFVIERSRSSKWGDYRPPLGRDERHRISVNGTLNPYAFLLTAVHEYAHLLVKVRHPRERKQAHGKEWKAYFTEALQPFLDGGCFPADISDVLRIHMRNPRASVTADLRLQEILLRYDELPENAILLRDLPEGSLFHGPDGRLFRKKSTLRKRVLCTCLNDRRDYRVYALLLVQPYKAEADQSL